MSLEKRLQVMIMGMPENIMSTLSGTILNLSVEFLKLLLLRIYPGKH